MCSSDLSMIGRLRYSQNGPETQTPDFMAFHRYAANFPWVSDGEWFLEQMRRAGQIDTEPDTADNNAAAAERVIRPDLYREACVALGRAYPIIDRRPRETHDGPWTLNHATAPIPMGPDRRLDGTPAADPTRSDQNPTNPGAGEHAGRSA